MVNIATNEGKIFEKCFKESVPNNIFFYRFKDVFSGFGENRSFTPSNMCDSLMYSNPNLFFIEMKSTKNTSFSFDEKIIKKHQIEDLEKASKFNGIIAGFVFNFRTTAETYFIHIDDFIKFKNSTTKKSINPKDCKEIGILIRQELKKVNYKYAIGSFVKECKERYFKENY